MYIMWDFEVLGLVSVESIRRIRLQWRHWLKFVCRVRKLIDIGAMGTGRLRLVILDMHADAKGLTILSVPQVMYAWTSFSFSLILSCCEADQPWCGDLTFSWWNSKNLICCRWLSVAGQSFGSCIGHTFTSFFLPSRRSYFYIKTNTMVFSQTMHMGWFSYLWLIARPITS